MEESIRRNLDTQHRRLAEIEAQLDRLLAGDLTTPSNPAATVVTPQSYDELTVSNDALRAERGWTNVDLDAALTAHQREQFAAWQARQRLPWTREDVIAVGLAGMVGMAATWFDSTIDREVRDRLKDLKDTELVKGWESDAHRMPIDYMGPGFGGRAHRIRSAGHDLGRPLEALRQIRDGQFRGIRWADGVRTDVNIDVGIPVANIGEALTLWGKHLVADVVTPMSLPLPWWTLLYELPSRDVRKFAHDAYSGSAFGEGLNVRSGLLTPTLAVLTTEAILRTHVHGRALMVSGSARLDPSQVALRTELLLAGHALVGAACLGKTITRWLVTSPATAVRHVNVPVLLRIGMLAVQVLRDANGRRSSAAPDWDMLLGGFAQPWQLDAALKLENGPTDSHNIVMTLDTAWALKEVESFLTLTDLYRPPDPPGRANMSQRLSNRGRQEDIFDAAQGHCCIERSVHPICSTHSLEGHLTSIKLSGLLKFTGVLEGSCLPAWCTARTLLGSMQQCLPHYSQLASSSDGGMPS